MTDCAAGTPLLPPRMGGALLAVELPDDIPSLGSSCVSGKSADNLEIVECNCVLLDCFSKQLPITVNVKSSEEDELHAMAVGVNKYSTFAEESFEKGLQSAPYLYVFADCMDSVLSIIHVRPPSQKNAYWDWMSIASSSRVVVHWTPAEYNVADELTKLTKESMLRKVQMTGKISMPLCKRSIGIPVRRNYLMTPVPRPSE